LGNKDSSQRVAVVHAAISWVKRRFFDLEGLGKNLRSKNRTLNDGKAQAYFAAGRFKRNF
jgi:hypothetical protein